MPDIVFTVKTKWETERWKTIKRLKCDICTADCEERELCNVYYSDEKLKYKRMTKRNFTPKWVVTLKATCVLFYYWHAQFWDSNTTFIYFLWWLPHMRNSSFNTNHLLFLGLISHRALPSLALSSELAVALLSQVPTLHPPSHIWKGATQQQKKLGGPYIPGKMKSFWRSL